MEYKDLRPVSILPALSKVVERIVEQQLRRYLDENKFLPLYQSGFRSGHSCLTALTCVVDDIITALDRGMVTVLVLLDYSRAFDTVNHTLLLNCLKYIGLDGTAVKFFENYLSHRCQMVGIEGEYSGVLCAENGVPQGSILGPLLFTIYSCNIMSSLTTCKYHMYADDSQIYYSFPPAELVDALSLINRDLRALAQMSNNHSLILNPTKSVAMVFGNVTSGLCNDIELIINDTILPIVSEAKNLGVFLDSSLRFRSHL